MYLCKNKSCYNFGYHSAVLKNQFSILSSIFMYLYEKKVLLKFQISHSCFEGTSRLQTDNLSIHQRILQFDMRAHFLYTDPCKSFTGIKTWDHVCPVTKVLRFNHKKNNLLKILFIRLANGCGYFLSSNFTFSSNIIYSGLEAKNIYRQLCR